MSTPQPPKETQLLNIVMKQQSLLQLLSKKLSSLNETPFLTTIGISPTGVLLSTPNSPTTTLANTTGCPCTPALTPNTTISTWNARLDLRLRITKYRSELVSEVLYTTSIETQHQALELLPATTAADLLPLKTLFYASMDRIQGLQKALTELRNEYRILEHKDAKALRGLMGDNPSLRRREDISAWMGLLGASKVGTGREGEGVDGSVPDDLDEGFDTLVSFKLIEGRNDGSDDNWN